MDKVTLGIPIYNAANLVERTLLSALNQTYPNIEFIFVDDKGNSMDIVRRIIAEHPRRNAVRIIDQKHNQGTGAARNAIVTYATGKYLFTMDCDDVIIPDCIEILYRKMVEHPVDFVAASFVRKDVQGNIYPGGCQYDDVLVEEGDYAVAQYRYGQGKNIFVATWNKLYRTDFLRKNKICCVPHYLIDDPWFTYQVIIRARSCRLISDCTLFFTYNPLSVTSVKEQDGYTTFLGEQYLGTQRLKADYIYSLALEAAEKGEPIVRHLEYVFPHQGFQACNDQYMLGDKYLVAPMVEKGTVRSVHLPKGRWKDEKGKIYKGGRIVQIEVPLERLPYFEHLK